MRAHRAARVARAVDRRARRARERQSRSESRAGALFVAGGQRRRARSAAVGNVARAFPNATVYVHEKGARHLVDPSRLVRSAAQVYGDLLDTLYGRLDPTPSERVHVLEDGETISIDASRTLTTVDSPGHAKHHLALHDSESGLLFAGRRRNGPRDRR